MMQTQAESLDPEDWDELRAQGHHMLDDMVNYLANLRQRPVWQPAPEDLRASFRETLPHGPSSIAQVHETFMRDILPYAVGNAHPGFFGWVHGGGTAVGMLAEMLAAGLNANVGGRNQVPVEVERQVVEWVRQLFDFPTTANGVFVTGTSMANFISILIARTRVLGAGVRTRGLADADKRLVAYTSTGAHGCIAQAMDMAGLGTDALRLIPMNDRFEMDIEALMTAIREDRRAGFTPFFIAGTAGSVNVGAVDDLAAIAGIAQDHGLWFHVDGAFGALAMLAPDLAPRLRGIQQADSIAFDFHKWGQVPYDAGFVLVRDGEQQYGTFAAPATYLRRETRGLAAGSPWPCDLGPDLSRGFRALKAWFTIKVYGADKLGQVISGTCRLASRLADKIGEHPELELMAPVSLNIVCFRHRGADPDRLNRDIVADIQESGIAAPSSTTVNQQLVIRVAIVNHRSQEKDLDALLAAVLRFGKARSGSMAHEAH
jgi:glutamate/tyrosine decarboxylase-like PLP-dependent enzyme